jgi:hypothetical protein
MGYPIPFGSTRSPCLAQSRMSSLPWLGSLYVYTNQFADARAIFQAASWVEPWNPVVQDNLRDPYWSPASSLSAAEAFAGSTPLELWRGESWVRPYPANPDFLVGPSNLTVGGKSWLDQIHLHPSGVSQPTILRFDVRDSHIKTILTPIQPSSII